jgi:hypothetical protein
MKMATLERGPGVRVRPGMKTVAALSLFGAVASMAVPGVVSAKSAVRSAQWCARHPRAAKNIPACQAIPGGGGGSGGDPATITVQVDPNPLVETEQGLVVAVIQVESSPSFAGDPVNIESTQLQDACGGAIFFLSLQNGTPTAPTIGIDNIAAVLDADGNATVVVDTEGCAPGSNTIEADLEVAPYVTALATFTVAPPVVTAAGVTGYPATSGAIAGEVATGDTASSGDSDVYAVFAVEADPVYAGQPVEIGSAQLESRCAGGWFWGGADGSLTGTGPNLNPPLQSTLDNDGNALFLFMGSACAPGSSEVIADVLAGTGPTSTAAFAIDAPAPTS